MPHYKDGREAKIGDRVRGVGYNAEGKGYDPQRGIEGIVVEVRPGEDRAGGCTLTIAFLKATRYELYADGTARHHWANTVAAGIPLQVDTEYGDTVGFERVG